jgi:hypothetical protein
MDDLPAFLVELDARPLCVFVVFEHAGLQLPGPSEAAGGG